MPTNRRRRAAKPRSWDSDHRVQLMIGHNILVPSASGGWGPAGSGPPYDPDTLAEMESCWTQIGPAMVVDYRRRTPGYRPWFWWHRQGLPVPSDQPATLSAMDELSPGEEKQLSQFDNSQER